MISIEADTGPMINEDLVRATCKRIAEHPETWDQGDWFKTTPCGTLFCFAGHALLASGGHVFRSGGFHAIEDGRKVPRSHIPQVAAHLLGLDYWQAGRLFFSSTMNVAAYLCLVADVTGVRIPEVEGRSDQ